MKHKCNRDTPDEVRIFYCESTGEWGVAMGIHSCVIEYCPFCGFLLELEEEATMKVIDLDWCWESGLDPCEEPLEEKKPKMITEWEDLEGKTIKKEGGVVPSPVDEGYILFFEDGDHAHVTGGGEDIHCGYWPILSDDEDVISYLKTEGYL